MNGASNVLVLGVTGQEGNVSRNKFKKEESKLFGRVAKESESERACRSRKAGKRRHAICKPGAWPREVHSLPAPSCIT